MGKNPRQFLAYLGLIYSQKNYCIPKGATVFGNTWAIGRDPEYFLDPEKFDPRRWIDEEGRIREDLKIFPYGSDDGTSCFFLI